MSEKTTAIAAPPPPHPGGPRKAADTLLTDGYRPRLRDFFLVLAVLAGVFALASPAATDAPRVLVAEFDNDVNPVTQSFLQDTLERGAEDGYSAVVIEMDTPGGLGSSMRAIVKSMLAPEIPVIVYVAPSGPSPHSAAAGDGHGAGRVSDQRDVQRYVCRRGNGGGSGLRQREDGVGIDGERRSGVGQLED